MRYLVGAVEHEWMIFPFSWEWKMIPTDELHHFSEGLVETTNQTVKNLGVSWCFYVSILYFESQIVRGRTLFVNLWFCQSHPI
jgi:hypothetical protein